MYYYVNIGIGNPIQKFNLIIDLQYNVIYSKPNWVELYDCADCAEFSNRFKPSESLTYRDTGVTSGGGVCQPLGNMSSDFFTFTGYGSVLSTRQTFVLAQTDSSCKDLKADGYIDFSYKGYTDIPIVQLLKNAGEISSAVFSLYLNNVTDLNDEGFPGSSLEIGGYNASIYSSDPDSLFFIPLASNVNKWTVKFTEISIGFYSVFNVTTELNSNINIIGDYNAMEPISSYLIANQIITTIDPDNLTISCSNCCGNELLPGLSLVYENYTLQLNSSSLWSCQSQNCNLLIEFRQTGAWDLGITFLQNYYTIFDYDNDRIGLAPAKISYSTNHKDSFSLVSQVFITLLGLSLIF